MALIQKNRPVSVDPGGNGSGGSGQQGVDSGHQVDHPEGLREVDCRASRVPAGHVGRRHLRAQHDHRQGAAIEGLAQVVDQSNACLRPRGEVTDDDDVGWLRLQHLGQGGEPAVDRCDPIALSFKNEGHDLPQTGIIINEQKVLRHTVSHSAARGWVVAIWESTRFVDKSLYTKKLSIVKDREECYTAHAHSAIV